MTALQQKAEHAAGKAEQFYVPLGLTLKELKERKPKGITWPEFVTKHFTIGKTRADELIRIASGTTTVDEVRTVTAERKKKHRANGRSGTSIPSPAIPERAAIPRAGRRGHASRRGAESGARLHSPKKAEDERCGDYIRLEENKFSLR